MADGPRLTFALTHLSSADWAAFEDFANAYLSDDFPELRPISGTGDEGRDAVLCAPDQPHIVVQHSIEEDWRGKISRTLDRLEEVGHACTALVYATSRAIGPRGEDLKRELLARGVFLDIRDRAYFVAQLDRSASKRAAARALAGRVVNPLLPGDEVVRNSAVADPELRVGLLYLEMQLQDVDEGRNITKLSYDTFVLGALRDTGPEARMSGAEIVDAIHATLSGRPPEVVEASVRGSLERLLRHRRIVVTRADDTYALHHEERLRREDAALALLQRQEEVRLQLAALVRTSADALEIPLRDEEHPGFLDALQQLFEQTLANQGNRFAEAVRTQTAVDMRSNVLAQASNVVTRNAAALRSTRVSRDALVELATEVATNAFLIGGSLRSYLRELADAYTLLAFMREAPDVQEAVGQFFSRGQLLLDTSALLPCFGEQLLYEEERRYTNLLRGAVEAGMSLYVTPGVINEVSSHFDLCMICHRKATGEWDGSVPRVYADWRELTGGGDFEGFVRRFRGDDGDADIELFLHHALGVTVVDVQDDVDAMPDELRYAVTEIWRPRKRMRRAGSEQDRDIRVRHDVEMYFAVLAWRRGEGRDLYGYEAWLLTEDGTALLMKQLAATDGVALPSDPCMSPNFLTNMLSIGPSRGRLGRGLREQLPVALDLHREGLGIPGLSRLADDIRSAHAGAPEWELRKLIRTRMNEIKRRPELFDPELATPAPE